MFTTFRHPDVSPVRKLSEGEFDLELWHYAFAFKDVALQLLFDSVARTWSETVRWSDSMDRSYGICQMGTVTSLSRISRRVTPSNTFWNRFPYSITQRYDTPRERERQVVVKSRYEILRNLCA